ncbi:MAG: two component, sigma54 specific, transcriptional regulator, Fis family [Myxococcales bacterium]|nr:two component, sigma54 specific, transcriptional regulator, Fis family [Myxococcales bacterium]
MRSRVLIADDQVDVLEALRLLLKGEGFDIVTAASPAGVLAVVEAQDLDAVLMDLNYARDTTSGKEGMDLLAGVQRIDATLPVIVMTAWSSVDGAVEAMRRGARDYLAKPWDNARVVATLRTQVELARALRRGRRLEDETSRQRARELPNLVAESPRMREVVRLMEKVAPSDANVLITGQHGTGKEVAARWLHAASKRADRPFVAVNAGGLAEGVFESELFGHVRGAFTDAKADRAGCIELADCGTLFLDEIANMPMAQQAKLLRVLQTGEFHPVGSSRVRRADVRVLSATNVDVTREVDDGRFREDLLYRLNTVEIRLPPLRERREDIAPLAAHFLARQAARYGNRATLGPDAMQALLEHPWPGNVRELEHVIERSLLLAAGDVVHAADLQLGGRGRAESSSRFEELSLDEAERYLIQRALEKFSGNVSDAARALGLSRSAFYRRLAHHGLKGNG